MPRRGVLRYPKTGERYFDVLNDAIVTCHDEGDHGPGKCRPDDHEILEES